MNDHETPKGRGIGCGPVATVIGVLVFYFASIGPFGGIWQNGKIPEPVGDKVWRTVYAPIAWVDDETDFFNDNPIGKAYAAYAQWWIKVME